MTEPDHTQLLKDLEERLEERRQAHRKEQARWKTRQRQLQRERRKADLRDGSIACLVVALLLGLAAWGTWWVVSGIGDWLAAPGRRHTATASSPSPSAGPAPSWKLESLTEGYTSKDTTLWTDMHDETQLRLLSHESADDVHSVRTDELDDDKGLTSADVEITITREPEHGTLELQADRSLALYTPDSGFSGEETFDYTIKLRGKPEERKIRYTVEVGLSPGARYRLEHKYENCDAARAAGAAPIRRGDDGYGRHLDADMDGVACE
ncbi:excalibur calcium-binding domain-containing protein [Streptomyces virginiae]|uniref:excalibur calcium-binding domain-containing protein n=1 Tax=Streptomyces virginiae TaxID=1961 RepID=UPI0036CEF1D5